MENQKDKTGNALNFAVLILLLVQSFFTVMNFITLRNITTPKMPINEISANDHPLIRKVFKDFNLEDENHKLLSLSGLVGEPTLLVFTSHSCQACQKLYPALISFSEKYPDFQIVLITANTSEENQNFKKERLEDKNLEWILLSGTPETFKLYEVSGTPTVFYLAPSGMVDNANHATTIEELAELTVQK